MERIIWRKHPLTALILLDKMWTPVFLLFGLVYVIINVLLSKHYYVFISWIIWLCISRCIKLSYYFLEKPQYIVYIPLFILFQYFQAIIKIVALFTLSERGWMTRPINVVGNEIVRTGDYAEENKSDNSSKVDIIIEMDGKKYNNSNNLSNKDIINKPDKKNNKKQEKQIKSNLKYIFSE